MISVEDYTEERQCTYKEERYSVRDNGAVMRHCREGKRPRKDDGVWTFGRPNIKTGYMEMCGERVHRIVAFAFHGEPPAAGYVVDHIDTNRRNNRPENLRWLTKLENVLLNETTRRKIEYLCGSIEAFLKDPSILKNFVYEDRNFSWMRTVSKEEGENTLLWWEKLKDNPRPKTQSSGLGEWMYSNPNQNTIEHPQHQLFGNDITEEQDFEDPEVNRSNETKKQKVDKTAPKKIIISELIDISRKHGWNVEKNVKGNVYKADILISYGDRKIAININRRKTKVDEEINEYKENGIEAYWFNSIAESPYDYNRDELYPYFGFTLNEDIISVQINESEECSIEEFIEAAIDNKIVSDNYICIKDIKVAFENTKCYKCNNEYILYVIPKIKFGNHYCVNLLQHTILRQSVSEFDPAVIEAVRKYILVHPEINFSTDIIKERYIKILDESFMSFGCPKCDCIYGPNYLDELKMELIYEDDSNLRDIHLEGDGVKLEYKHWTIKNN